MIPIYQKAITKEVKAAIIGYWRSGATIEQIIGKTHFKYDVIENIIKEYKHVLNK